MRTSLSKDELRQIKHELQQEKSMLERRLDDTDDYGLVSSLKESIGELSSYDNHPGDTGTETYEREKDFALMENDRNRLIEINEALERMDQGIYGLCQTGGEPISFERLLAVPTTRHCKEHVPVQEHSERRPIEEEFLMPPFGRTSLDETDATQFDGEDAWQIVANWGTSDSPAMSENREIDDFDDNYNELLIESDENDGYVEPLESFLATDMYGQDVTVVRNREYLRYMNNGEGDPLLEYRNQDREDDLS